MSYTISLRAQKCEHCGVTPEIPWLPDPTYNLTPVFDFALTGEPMPNEDVSEIGVVLYGHATDRPRGLRLLDGRRASDTIGVLSRAVERMRDPALAATFDSLKPANGWGDVAGALEVLEKLLLAADRCPSAVWEVR